MPNEEVTRRRRGDRSASTPERVGRAAESMRPDLMSGTGRGYIPPQRLQNTNPGFNAVPPQSYPPQQGYPSQQGYPPNAYGNAGYQAGSGYAGQGYGSGQGGMPNRAAVPGSRTGQTQRYQTASYGRGYVAVQQPAPEPEKRPRKGHALAVVLAVLAVVILGVGGTFAAMSYSRTKQISDRVEPYNRLFVPGVYVDGIALGGMTPEQALNSVQSQIQQRNDAWKVQLTYQGNVLAEINASMLGMSVDIGEVMNRAWAQGHEGDYEQRYAAMAALEEEPYQAYTAVPSGDTSVIDSLLSQIKASIEKPATDASLVAFDTTQPYPFIFTDETYGLRLDTEPIRENLYRMVATLVSGKIELQPETVAPAVTVNDLKRHYMLRSSVYTPISTSSTEERNNNIRRAFEKINGYVLDPGKNFSFNDVVGERSIENGFFPAIEYAYKEHVMGVGGGVCQASTTLYQAAVCAGMSIVKREPHSDEVNYTDYGKDATVYWMYNKRIDFVFKNTSDEPLYIVAAVQEDPSNKRRLIAKISMYGQDMGDVRYELEAEVVEEIPAPVNPEYVKDKQGTYVTYTDQEKSVSKAKPGYVVQSYRLEYTGNVLTDRKNLYRDVYEPKAERIYVGVKRRE